MDKEYISMINNFTDIIDKVIYSEYFNYNLIDGVINEGECRSLGSRFANDFTIAVNDINLFKQGGSWCTMFLLEKRYNAKLINNKMVYTEIDLITEKQKEISKNDFIQVFQKLLNIILTVLITDGSISTLNTLNNIIDY